MISLDLDLDTLHSFRITDHGTTALGRKQTTFVVSHLEKTFKKNQAQGVFVETDGSLFPATNPKDNQIVP